MANLVKKVEKTMAVSSPSSRFRIGKWDICEFLGAGAYGTVWKAQHADLQYPAALKILDRFGRADAELQAVQLITSKLHSSETPASLTKIHDYLDQSAPEAVELYQQFAPEVDWKYRFGMVDEAVDAEAWSAAHANEELPVIVCEFVNGDPPNERILEEVNPARLIEAWAVQIIEALEYLDEHKFRHGDIHPGNLKVDGKGNVRIIDYSLLATTPAAPVSYPNPKYRAPEELESPPPNTTIAADLYAAGLTLYEWIYGEVPQPHERTSDITVRLPGQRFNVELEELLNTLLKQNPDERMDAFRIYGRLRTDTARRTPRGPWPVRKVTAYALLTSAVLAVVASIGLVVWSYVRPNSDGGPASEVHRGPDLVDRDQSHR